jgi:hypothetical protein
MKTSLFLEDKEWLILYSKTGNQTLQLPRFLDTVIYLKVSVGENSEYVNLGDWITYFTYGVLMGNFEIKNTKLIHWDKYQRKPVTIGFITDLLILNLMKILLF